MPFEWLLEARQKPPHTTEASSPLKMTLTYSHKAVYHWPIHHIQQAPYFDQFCLFAFLFSFFFL